MKKRILALVLAAMITVMCVCLTGCGGSKDKEAVTTAVQNEFAVPMLTLNENTSWLLGTSLERYGINDVDFVQRFLDGFEVSVDKVKVDGNTATVDLTFTAKKLSDLSTVFQKEMSNVSLVEVLSNPEFSLNNKVTEAIWAALDQTAPAKFDTVTATLHKAETGWALDVDASTLLSQAFLVS